MEEEEYDELGALARLIDPSRDGLYQYDKDESDKVVNSMTGWLLNRPFSNVLISPVAMLKIVEHADSGGTNEVMGLMQGYTTLLNDGLGPNKKGKETVQEEAPEEVRSDYESDYRSEDQDDSQSGDQGDGQSRGQGDAQPRDQGDGQSKSQIRIPSEARAEGAFKNDTFVLTDAFRLPVKGTETQVNAGAQADEFLLQYLDLSVGAADRQENAVGWYHSHPGYDCWLSGVDVQTQANGQKSGPWVAVVVDPFKTIQTQSVRIGAFRTHPDKPPVIKPTGLTPFKRITDRGQAIETVVPPRNLSVEKDVDFGRHASKYHPLSTRIYMSTLDRALLSILDDANWDQTLGRQVVAPADSFVNGQLGALADRLTYTRRVLERAGSLPAAPVSIHLDGFDSTRPSVVEATGRVEDVLGPGSRYLTSLRAGQMLAVESKITNHILDIQKTLYLEPFDPASQRRGKHVQD